MARASKTNRIMVFIAFAFCSAFPMAADNGSVTNLGRASSVSAPVGVSGKAEVGFDGPYDATEYQDEAKKGLDFDYPTAKVNEAVVSTKLSNTAATSNLQYPIDGSLHHVQVDVMPFSPLVETKGEIPKFLATHRVFKKSGHSITWLVEVQANGNLKQLRVWKGWVEEQKGGMPLPESERQKGTDTQFPDQIWKIKLLGWVGGSNDAAKGMRLVYRKGAGTEEKTYRIPSWGLTFGPRPLCYDAETNRFYFTVTNGPTGYRFCILLQFDLNTGALREIGRTGNVVLSPDQKWILWFPWDFIELGGKDLYTSSLAILSIKDGKSFRLTKGNDQDGFVKWVSH